MAAARSFFAYAGPYDVDESAGTVTHHLTIASVPNWVGDHHLRHVLMPDHDDLTLTADPMPTPAGPLVLVLTFTRRQQA